MFDSVSISLFVGIVFLFTLAFVYCCIKRYEFAVFVIVLSPWVTAILLPEDATGISEEAVGIGSSIRVIIVGLIGIIGFLQFIKLRKTSEQKISNQFYFLGLFLLLALLSISYSLDQKYTAIRSLNFVAFYFFLLGLNYWLYCEENLNITLNACFWAITLCLTVNALSLITFPEKAWLFNRFRGLLGHSNSMGVFCMVSYPILLWKYWHCQSKLKYISICLVFLCVILHLLTGSRTSLAASVFGIAIWFAIYKKKRQLAIFFAAIFCCFIIFVGYEYTPSRFARERSSSLSHLTGRPEIWEAGFTLARERPILGYGYSVGGKVFEDPRFYDARLEMWSGNPRASLHNGYLSVFIGIGSVGLIVFCISLFLALWNCLRAPNSSYKAFVISIISMALLVNCFETAIVGGRSIDSVVMWIAWVIAGRMIKVDKPLRNRFI
jgi:O-antigen ligase